MLAPALLVLRDDRRVAALVHELEADRALVGRHASDVAVVTGAGRRAEIEALLGRDDPDLLVVCDRAAAEGLPRADGTDSDHVVVVLGHREPGRSAEHRISAHSRARMLRAEELCLETSVRAAVLTGYTHTAGLSEAEQMGREWTLPGVPPILEVAGRNTAENASRSLPLILAMGDVHRVTVVTSPWHARAPYFFAPYRRHGLRVRFRTSRALRGWAHLLAHELLELPAAPRQRRAAFGR
jgi:DUF218 domain